MPDNELDGHASTFRWADGKVVVPTAEYNRLNAQHGSTWNWCQSYGLKLRDAVQNDDGTITVYCEQITQEPAPAEAPVAPAAEGEVSPTGDAPHD